MFISIVGSRACSSCEAKAAYDFAHELAKQGHIIVSGLARGIDTAALSGCVDAKALGLAILPTSPGDGIYPPANARLALEIQRYGGVLIEPFASTCDALWRFRLRLIERNFLMAQWCNLCIVVSDQHTISGGTAWMVAFCQSLHKTVLRLDSNHALSLDVPPVNRKVTWEPELTVIR